MDVTCDIKSDFTLRRFLLNPEAAGRSAHRSPGLATIRFSIAIADAVQMIVGCVVASWACFPKRMVVSAGIGLLGASLALAIRLGLRPTTRFQRITIAGAANRAAFAVIVACLIMLTIIMLVDRPAHAIQFAP